MSEPGATVPPRFAFLAGRPALDLANTVDWHGSDHPRDRLGGYADLVAWAREAGLLAVGDAGALLAEAGRRPEAAAAAFERAVALREAVYRAFSRLAGGGVPDDDALAALTDAWRGAARRRRLVAAPDGVAWHDDPDPADLDRAWHPLARDAADLLASPERRRVRECADDRGCGWLFLDTSKSGRRRWCAMEDCGNRAKALRHRRRAGAAPSA